MELRVIGPLEVRVGEQVLPLSGARQRTVLALLLLRAGEVVSSDRLIDELWGERPPPSALDALRVYVSRLRKVLPEGTVVTEVRRPLERSSASRSSRADRSGRPPRAPPCPRRPGARRRPASNLLAGD
jgi:DNA-binding SARP family transcriptional activator